jgi:hypothetical protein
MSGFELETHLGILNHLTTNKEEVTKDTNVILRID